MQYKLRNDQLNQFDGDRARMDIGREELKMYLKGAEEQPAIEKKSPKGFGYATDLHVQNFLECVRTRRTPSAPMRVAFQARPSPHRGGFLETTPDRRIQTDVAARGSVDTWPALALSASSLVLNLPYLQTPFNEIEGQFSPGPSGAPRWTASIFPEQDVVARFRPVKVQALRAHLASEAGDLHLSVDDLVYFQLALILLRLGSDYLSAFDLVEAHRDGFARAYPRVLTFNPVTNTVSWDAVRKQMEEILEEGFRHRYDEMTITNSQHFRDSRLANEALMIGMMLIGGRESQSESPAGLAFESECEVALQGAGFTVERTPISGDFGVDLLARKHGLTYAVQCKCYSVPVGVSAVQEAAAGRLHYTADCAVVVASSGFTNQARRLAESNAVLLIGPPQVAELEHLSRPLL